LRDRGWAEGQLRIHPHAGAFGYFMFSEKYDWSYSAKPDPNLRHGSPIFCPRGKTLGGSTSINGMVYTRGHRSDYDR